MVLVIDDEMDFLDSVKRGLISAGIRDVRAESDPRVAASSIQQGDRYAVALIDITMPWITEVQLLEIIKGVSPDTECIMVTAVNDEVLSVGKAGSLPQIKHKDAFAPIVTQSEKMLRLLKEADFTPQAMCPPSSPGRAAREKSFWPGRSIGPLPGRRFPLPRSTWPR